MLHSLPPDVELAQTAAAEELERRLMNDIRSIEQKLQDRKQLAANPIEELSTSGQPASPAHANTNNNDPGQAVPEKPPIQHVLSASFSAEVMRRIPQIDVEKLETFLSQAEDALAGNKIHGCANNMTGFIAEHTRQATETGELYIDLVHELSKVTEAVVDEPSRLLRGEIQSMETQISQVLMDRETTDQLKNDLQKRVAAMENELEAKKALMTRKEERHNELNLELEKLLERNIKLQTDLQSLEENIRGASAETELVNRIVRGKHGDGVLEFLLQRIQELVNAKEQLKREIDRCRTCLRRL